MIVDPVNLTSTVKHSLAPGLWLRLVVIGSWVEIWLPEPPSCSLVSQVWVLGQKDKTQPWRTSICCPKAVYGTSFCNRLGLNLILSDWNRNSLSKLNFRDKALYSLPVPGLEYDPHSCSLNLEDETLFWRSCQCFWNFNIHKNCLMVFVKLTAGPYLRIHSTVGLGPSDLFKQIPRYCFSLGTNF